MLLSLHDSADKTNGTYPVPWLDEHAQTSNLNVFLLYISIWFLKLLMNVTLKSTFHEHEMQSLAYSQKVNPKGAWT